MKKIVSVANEKKYISLSLLCFIFFTYLSLFRSYVYDNIFKAFTLGNLGGFAAKIKVSSLVVILFAICVIVGVCLVILLRKKLSDKFLKAIYSIFSFFPLLLLFFTPYNMQLIFPAQNLQNLSMITFLVVLVFGCIDIALLAGILFWQIYSVSKNYKLLDYIILFSLIAPAFVLAILGVVYQWSFFIIILVSSVLLLTTSIVSNIISAFAEPSTVIEGETDKKLKIVLFSVLAVFSATCLIAGYFITESHIFFVYF